MLAMLRWVYFKKKHSPFVLRNLNGQTFTTASQNEVGDVRLIIDRNSRHSKGVGYRREKARIQAWINLQTAKSRSSIKETRVLTGATILFFAYVGFDTIANSAEESRRPQLDLPLGIIGSLLICIGLCIGVCLVITRIVPYNLLVEDAPLAEVFMSKGLKFISVIISVAAVAGLTTTLLVGLYVQTRYSVVSACVLSLRFKEKIENQSSGQWFSRWAEGIICLVVLACCGFTAGVIYRFDVSYYFLIIQVAIALGALAALYLRQYFQDIMPYSEEQIDEVRDIWASYFLNV